MARVATYQRNVNVVLTDILTGPTNNIEIQHGIKIKEEPVDTTMTTTEDCAVVINNDDLIDQHKSLRTGNLHQVVNNKENEHLSDSNFTHLSNVRKTYNLKRKRAKDVEKQIYNTSSQSAKRRKCSNEVSTTTSTSCTTLTKNLKKSRKKRVNIGKNLKGKMHRPKLTDKKVPVQCDVCFRDFNHSWSLEFHMKYYEGVYICKICKSYYETQSGLSSHSKSCHLNKTHEIPYRQNGLFCNFCNRRFKMKFGLQSHLFHTHEELIHLGKTGNCKTPTSKNRVSTSCQNDTLKVNAHEESPSTNLVESKKLNKSLKNDAKETTKSSSEESLATGMLSPKKLRQPTLMEYLELYKKNYDTKNSRRDLGNTKNHLSTSVLKKEGDSSCTKSNNRKQVTDSTLKQNTSHEICYSKQAIVTLRTNIKTMVPTLEKDTNMIAKKESITNHTDDILSYDREVPYSLRSFQNTSVGSNQSNSTLEKQKPRTRSASKSWKTIMNRFKCKNYKVLLTRCDEKPNNNCQIPTIETTTDVSLNAQHNSSLCQAIDTQTEVMFKRLEVSLERMKPVLVLDTKAKTTSDVENHDNYKCNVCKEIFSSKENKRMHIKSCHIAYMSSICNARYTSKQSLLQHYLREHLLEQTQCCVCYTSLSDYEALKEHLNIHCLKYIYKKNNKYAVDVEIKCNSDKESYKCCYCNNVFSSQSTLVIHQSQCTTQKEMENEKSNAQERNNETAKSIFEVVEHNNIETMLREEEIISHDLCQMSNNSGEMSTMRRISESEKEVNFEEDNQPSFFGNLLSSIESVIVEGSETITQNSEQGLEDSSVNKDVSNAEQEPTGINTSIYPCNICGKQFQNSKNLRQHIRSFSNTTDVCPLCETAFSSKRLLQSHIVAAHVPQISKTYNFHCMFCNQGFVKKYELRPHVLHLHGQQMFRTFMRDSHNNPDNLDGLCTGICDVCNIKFETRDRYAEHRMYYYKNHKFTCSICRQDFQGMYMFHHHYKLAHYSEHKRKSYKYICDICNEGFNHESHFYSHKMHVHVNEETSTAIAKTSETGTLIDHGSETREKVRKAMEQKENDLIHLSNNEYVCPICQLKCVNVNDIVNHILLYSTFGNFKCDKCNRQCKTRDVLEQHKKLTHTCRDIYNGYLCHICGEILETVTSLQCHEKHFHSNSIEYQSNANSNRYKCFFCGATFLSADIIQKHINDHVDHGDIPTNLRFTLKPAQFANDSNITQEKSVQQFVQINQALSRNFSNQSLERSNTVVTDMTTNQSLERSNNVVTDMTTKNSNNTIAKPCYKHLEYLLGNNIKDTQKKQISAILSPEKSEVNISTATTANNRSKIVTSVPSPIESSNKSQQTSSLNSPKNDFKVDSIPVTNNSSKVITVPVTSTTGVLKIILAKHKTIKPAKQNFESVNSITNFICNYVCPFCSLVYPSLMFFHAHLAYAHANYIRKNSIAYRPQPNQTGSSGGHLIPVGKSAQTFSTIECLICPALFTDETSYKIHLKNVHTRHIVVSKGTVNTNSASNPLIITTNKDRKNTSPEIITIDDDNNNDSNNIETSEKNFAAKTTAMTNILHESLNENIGKLRVKPFAKINENLLSAETSK